MANVSNIQIIGRTTRDTESRYTPSGKLNVVVNVAVNRRRANANGEATETATFYRCTLWGKLAETMDRLAQQGALPKGKECYIAGSFEPREYTAQNGETRVSYDVNVSELQLLGGRENHDEPLSVAPSNGYDDPPF